jgi:hypothetical protein
MSTRNGPVPVPSSTDALRNRMLLIAWPAERSVANATIATMILSRSSASPGVKIWLTPVIRKQHPISARECPRCTEYFFLTRATSHLSLGVSTKLMIPFLVGVFTGICLVIGAQALLWENSAPLNEESNGASVSKHRRRLPLVRNPKAEHQARTEPTLYPPNSST